MPLPHRATEAKNLYSFSSFPSLPLSLLFQSLSWALAPQSPGPTQINILSWNDRFVLSFRKTSRQSVWLFVCLSVWLFVCRCVCLFVCLSVCRSGCLSVGLSVCLSICLSVGLAVCLSVRLSVCVAVCLYLGPLPHRAPNEPKSIDYCGTTELH